MPPPVLRFAPSPTGLLHIGNLRTALLNVLFARHAGGQLILRFDDTDEERCEERFVDAIRADLAWVGITPDREERQSRRAAAYESAFERLRAAGLVYPCYESAEELERKRRLLLARRLPPVYDRAALRLDEAERAALEAQGRKPHWRFRLPRQTLQWQDLICGRQSLATASLSDPVLRRADGHYLYMLPSVVDDIDMGISHVIRGADHITNTAVQLCLFAALEGQPPAFAHHSLMLAADGSKLAKRLQGLSLAHLRADGIEPLALACLLARLGSAHNPAPAASLDQLAAGFSLDGLSRAPVRFDPAALEALNARLLHDMPYAQAQPRLHDLQVEGGEAFWHAVRGNLSRFGEAQDWWRLVSAPLQPVIDSAADGAMLATARDCLPPPPWGAGSYRQWVGEVKQATGRSGRRLFLPLRLALTGREHGPELEALLPLLGHERVAARLSGQKA